MTHSNLPIVWQNALGQYGSQITQKAWIWFAETRGHGMQYQADCYANQVNKLVLALRPYLAASQKQHIVSDELIDDLLRFILIRHANYYFGGNVIPTYLKG